MAVCVAVGAAVGGFIGGVLLLDMITRNIKLNLSVCPCVDIELYVSRQSECILRSACITTLHISAPIQQTGQCDCFF